MRDLVQFLTVPDLFYEQQAAAKGYKVIAGIDEAGRGPLAGPVTVAAVILPVDFEHAFLNDSKKLTEKKREALYEELTNDDRILFSVEFITAQEIDRLNILKATHYGMAKAAENLKWKPDYCLIDGLPVPNFSFPHEGIVKGDGKSLSIAAASILAKVSRDRYMLELAAKYPNYGFEKHKGYGTKLHMAAIEKHGPIAEHRRTFAPVSQMNLL